MPGQWLNQAENGHRRLRSALEGGWYSLAQPERAARLRKALCLLLLVWAVMALVQIVWALVPAPDVLPEGDLTIINPIESAGATAAGRTVDIEALVAHHLFGKANADGEAARLERERQLAQQAADRRAGIEDGARETRLELRLVGIVASTIDGAGHAVIEHRRKQDIYTIDDKLPVSGRVTLAKVMPQQVVLNNGGTYELLKLFDKNALEAQNPAPARVRTPRPPAAPQTVSSGDRASALARDYRNRLYSNPQSLAEVVTISPAKVDDELQGYRLAPGSQLEQFNLLGFKEGDVVTAVNGIALSNPGNTVRLWQRMRTAQQATFELQRNGQPVTVQVNLEEPAGGQ